MRSVNGNVLRGECRKSEGGNGEDSSEHCYFLGDEQIDGGKSLTLERK